MVTLANNSLTVSVLDPATDRDRFGTRYCTGGYIFQIDDARHGPLLSGANYPDGFIPYNGQGIPDAFNLNPLMEYAVGGPNALIIGIGLCDLERDQVLEFSDWQVEQSGASVRMQTRQAYQSFALTLERTVSLSERTVRSLTRLKNVGRSAIPLRWFPHPFYPQPTSPELCRFNIPVRVPENAGYELKQSGYIARKNLAQMPGHYLAVDMECIAPLTVLQRHPLLGLVGGTCSYVPTFLPIWGNERTFSWEPFLERMVAAGQSAEWWIDYDF